MRQEVQPTSVWLAQRPVFIKVLLEWLGAPTGPELVAEMLKCP
jgi:hypothetical protein